MRRFQGSAASGRGFFLMNGERRTLNVERGTLNVGVGGLNLAFSARLGLVCDFVVGLKHLTPQLYKQLLPPQRVQGETGDGSLAPLLAL
jgi:hypothetical protein